MFLPQVLPWLDEQGSITDKLKALSGHTQLEVLTHIWDKPDVWDCEALQLSPDIKVLHREILMSSHQQYCWYARTILPLSVYQTEATLFQRLKHEALGELIHNHPHINRTHIKPYEIAPHTPEHHYLKQALKDKTPTQTLWGRLSTFTIHGQFDFYLLEILLPGILRYCL